MSLLRRLALAEGWDPARVDRTIEEVDLLQETPRCRCGAPATVRKTRRRRLVTLAAGDTCIRVRQYLCDRHEIPVIFSPNEPLHSLAPRGQSFGWDVIAEVGLLRHVERRQREEIRQELRERYNIRISTGTVSALADRFVYYLGQLHRERGPVLRAFLENQGGYALHIDSTNETGKGGLFVGMEGARHWILGAGRIETEREELLTPVLKEIVEHFGLPLAIVRDMSKACKAAAEPWRKQGVPDFICHFHFVQDIGRDLLQQRHKRLQQILRSSGASSLLKSLDRSARQAARNEDSEQRRFAAFIYWLRRGEDRRPVRSPFTLEARDQHARLLALPSKIDHWLEPPLQARNQEALDALLELSARLAENEELRGLVEDLRGRWQLFEELRQILRLEGDELMRPREPMLPDVEIKARQALENELENFEKRLERHARSSRSPHALILRHLQRHKQYLFHQPAVADAQGTILFLVDRTNNGIERSFGKCKQNLRRRTGRCRLTRDLEDLPPDALLTMNLQDPDYVRILCGSLDNLPQAFARLGLPPVPADDIRDHPSRSIQSLVRRLIKEDPTLAATSS